jgi:glucose-6-phosphate 1-epimerase
MSNGLQKVSLCASGPSGSRATLEMCLFGAHVTSWKCFTSSDCHGNEYLWMSSLSNLDGSAPIRGGIPIAFPQFADNGPMKLHGFARENMWTIASRTTDDDSDKIELSLSSNNDISMEWNFHNPFTLSLCVELRISSFKMQLRVHNTSSTDPLSFTGCMHTYFRTPDITRCSVSGLQGLPFIDKVDGYTIKVNDAASFDIAAEMSSEESASLAEGKYFVDRIYQPPAGNPCPLTLIDSSSNRQFRVEKSLSWPEWVVFNPWIEGKKGSLGPDFDDDGYQHMICLEPAVATEAIVIAPNACWEGEQIISVQTIM